MRHLTEISHMVAQAIILEQLQMMTAESELGQFSSQSLYDQNMISVSKETN